MSQYEIVSYMFSKVRISTLWCYLLDEDDDDEFDDDDFDDADGGRVRVPCGSALAEGDVGIRVVLAEPADIELEIMLPP